MAFHDTRAPTPASEPEPAEAQTAHEAVATVPPRARPRPCRPEGRLYE